MPPSVGTSGTESPQEEGGRSVPEPSITGGLREGDGLGISTDDVRGLEPLQTQTLSDDELARAANLGKNGPRDVSGLTTTHTVPNERVVLA
jgi:hypothetical protein